MDTKTKKITLLTFITVIIVLAISMIYMFNNSNDLESNSGRYFLKINILTENSRKVSKWNIGISKTETKNNIYQSEFNMETLRKFETTIHDISSKKFCIFLLLLYLTFILINFVAIERDSQIYKNKNDKRSFQLIVTLLIIFLIYKVSISSIELNNLYINADYYFSLIS